jgi:hypothetical protein
MNTQAHLHRGRFQRRSRPDRDPTMPNLSGELSSIPEGLGQPPWPGEYVKGWGVFALPFDSGHVLALRVFPQGSFAPYRTVWHRDPNGDWSIFVDGPQLETACPRYYGEACVYTGYSQIQIGWTAQSSLRVTMEKPRLEWTLTASSTRFLSLVNSTSHFLPPASWRLQSLLRLREMTARVLGLGSLQLSGVMPSGHTGTLMPERMYFINEASATFEGTDLGRPVVLPDNPRMGDVPLPARGVLAVGGAVWDPELRPTQPRRLHPVRRR